jgi:hypothetical protein
VTLGGFMAIFYEEFHRIIYLDLIAMTKKSKWNFGKNCEANNIKIDIIEGLYWF